MLSEVAVGVRSLKKGDYEPSCETEGAIKWQKRKNMRVNFS